MTIYVDADACPVKQIVERIAEQYGIPLIFLCDTSHTLPPAYGEVRVIGEGADAVDLALINLCHAGDIVVSQDYGVAALALGKKCYCIHQRGRWYTDDNIDTLLVSFYFCFNGFFNGYGETRFVMIQGMLGAFCVRLPVSFLMSRIQPVSLFRIGLAVPLSSVVQILLCLLYFFHLRRKLENASEEA